MKRKNWLQMKVKRIYIVKHAKIPILAKLSKEKVHTKIFLIFSKLYSISINILAKEPTCKIFWKISAKSWSKIEINSQIQFFVGIFKKKIYKSISKSFDYVNTGGT